MVKLINKGKRQIWAEEFQVNYADTPSSGRWSRTPHTPTVSCTE